MVYLNYYITCFKVGDVMVKVDTRQLENDYKVAKDLMEKNKYIQAVLHLEKVLKNIRI